MAQLINFNGGLNTRLAPHLISINEAQVYTNADSSKGSLTPLMEDTDENISSGKYLINFNGLWVSSNTYKDYLEFQEKLYYSDSVGIPQKSADGLVWDNLGIAKPLAAPTSTIAGVGVIVGTIQYCYTYYNVDDGTESMPSEYSTELISASNTISISLALSKDKQVTHIRLYRLGGNITTMSLVAELLATAETYTDNLGDLDIVGDVLDSYNNGQAPKALNYLTTTNAMMFGTKSDKLYYSDNAFINNWSPFNFIDFRQPITGIGAVPNGLLVFTKFETYIVTGTSPTTLSKYLLSGNQGCVSHKSIRFADNQLIWVSTDGVCVSNGSSIRVISRPKLGKTFNIADSLVQCEVFDDVYYVAYSDGILALDFRFGFIISNLNTQVDGLAIYNDVLYYSYGGLLYSLGTSNIPRELVYKSPILSDGMMSQLKNYKNVHVSATGTLTLKTYINEVLVSSQTIDSTTSEVKLPQELRKGYTISFEATGTGTLNELEYKIEGRQNGR